MKVEFYKHNVSEEDKMECRKVLDSLFLTTGEMVKQFEEQLARYLGVEHAVGVMSCTDALFLALRYCGVGPGDQVITTPLSFIATANAIEYCGAQPVFVDVDGATGNIDVRRIEAAITPRTKVILPVHLYGQMADMKTVRTIADRHALKIIEDCAHCIEGERDGIKPGQLGDVGCFSFYATKNITCGEGGALVAHTADAAAWLSRARLHGMSKNAADRYAKKYEHYDMEFLGYKMNMTNIAAALLVHQLESIEQLLVKKEAVSQQYDTGFRDNSHIARPAVVPGSKHARHLYTIWVNSAKRDEYMHALQEKGIGVAVNFRPIHLMKYYREKYQYAPGSYPAAENIGNATITIPLYPKLTADEVAYVIAAVNEVVTA